MRIMQRNIFNIFTINQLNIIIWNGFFFLALILYMVTHRSRSLSKITLKCCNDIIQNKDKVVVQDDKDWRVVNMKKSDYITQLNTLIGQSIMKGTYIVTTVNKLKALLQFQDFLYRNLWTL